jgi:hypothetical protein
MSNLPERYAFAVTRNLPQAQREETGKELIATIEDMAADRAKNGKPTDADIKEVLKELGDPRILAHKYTATRRYLIGPRWYDTYITLLKTLLLIVPEIVAAIMLVIGFVQHEGTIIQNIIRAIGVGIGVAIQIAFWVTLTFALLERGAAGLKPEELSGMGPWTPDDLPEIPKDPERQITRVDAWCTAAFVAAGMIWIAISPILHVKDGQQLISPALWDFWLPAALVLGALTLAHKVAQAKIGNWTTPLTVTHVLLNIVSIVFVVTLGATQQLVNTDYFVAWHITTPIHEILEGIRWGTGFFVVAAVATYLWEGTNSVILNRRLRKKTK